MGMQQTTHQGSLPQYPGGPPPQCSTLGQVAPPQSLVVIIMILEGELSAILPVLSCVVTVNVVVCLG